MTPPYPPSLRWRTVMLRLVLLNEILIWVGAVSMHVTDVLAGHEQASLGLPYQLLWMHCIGVCGLLINGSTMLLLARRAWRLTPDMEARYAARGVYLGLPAKAKGQLMLGALASIAVSSLAARALMAACLALPGADALPQVVPPFDLPCSTRCMAAWRCTPSRPSRTAWPSAAGASSAPSS
jgi:hypothetical protein